ncbi:MAG: TetR/AcrR family transcriptional regulator [Bauldia sp.]|nr:TetR/AcrR family transcriptional regulator [Bauldia sp.]
MATGPRRSRRKGGGAEAAAPRQDDTRDPRERIVDAFMALLAERGPYDVGLGDIAGQAGVSLADLRELYDGKLAILADFSKRIDRQVLAQGVAQASEDGPRHRLFEVMMRRFDALGPYKPAIRRVARAARRDPGLACALHGIALGAQKWTFAAAGIHKRGALGMVAAEGAVLVYAEAMRTWLDDDAPDLARTMAALDRALRRGERAMQMVSNLCCLLPRFADRARRDRDTGRAAA